MKNSFKIILGVSLFLAAVWACNTHHASVITGQNTLPQNVLVSCTVPADTFNHWFVKGTASENGAVNPANSVTFPHQNNCDFYQWSENMFLWATSPDSGQYGGGKSVLESPVFYNVSPEDANGQRTLTPHGPGPLRLFSHITQNGSGRLPVIISKTGKLFEVEMAKPKANALAQVRNAAGNTVEVANVKIGAGGTATFFDKTGKPIPGPKALLRLKGRPKNTVEEFMADKKPVFLDAEGRQVQTEAGQATGDVLMAQNGSLVYYLTLVNDVYAYFLTAVHAHYMSGNEFPTTAADRDSICTFARKYYHKALPDSNALAMELKTSWVEASKLADPQDYFTINAIIPTYDTTNNLKWVPKGEKTVKMALVGMHVVGSAAGHPEMIWATFEHQGITPNAAYTYVDVNNKVDTVKQDSGSGFMFSSNAGDPSPNVSHMTNEDSVTQVISDTIFAKPGHTISPSNTLMANPWGSAMDSTTNAEDKSSAASNSEVIAINNTIIGDLKGNDVRKQYLLIGATWTSGGAPPTGISYGSDTTAGVSIGTSVLANSTMETYIQLTSTSCFTCHSGSTPSLAPGDLSHIFGGLQPLPPPMAQEKKKK